MLYGFNAIALFVWDYEWKWEGLGECCESSSYNHGLSLTIQRVGIV